MQTHLTLAALNVLAVAATVREALVVRASRLGPEHRRDSGEVSSTVIYVAIFAALAIAVGAIITAKVTSKANSIPTG